MVFLLSSPLSPLRFFPFYPTLSRMCFTRHLSLYLGTTCTIQDALSSCYVLTTPVQTVLNEGDIHDLQELD